MDWSSNSGVQPAFNVITKYSTLHRLHWMYIYLRRIRRLDTFWNFQWNWYGRSTPMIIMRWDRERNEGGGEKEHASQSKEHLLTVSVMDTSLSRFNISIASLHFTCTHFDVSVREFHLLHPIPPLLFLFPL